MNDDVLARMHRRAREVATRAAVRRWQYRQRHHAAGVWLRLRRVLAAAETIYAIPPEEASALVAEGYVPEACGQEIAPPKTIVFVDRGRADAIVGRHDLPVKLGPEFMAAPAVALVRFDDAPAPSSASAADSFRASLDLFACGVELMRQNLRRQHPDLAEEGITELLRRWLEERPGAELGDSPGVRARLDAGTR